jgi:phage-related protein
VPVLEWLLALPVKAQDKCRVRLEPLRECGHELRRPEADYLRVRLGTVNCRMLYFFHGQVAAVVWHGLVKEGVVPAWEIELALQRRLKFLSAPRQHSAEFV